MLDSKIITITWNFDDLKIFYVSAKVVTGVIMYQKGGGGYL